MKNTKYSPVYHCLAWGVLFSPAILLYIHSSARIQAGEDQAGFEKAWLMLTGFPAVLSILFFALALVWLIVIKTKKPRK